MALRKPFVISTEGFQEEIPIADSLDVGAISVNAAGAGIDMNATKLFDLGAATAAGDAISYAQTGAELGDLTITSGGDIDVAGGGELTGLPATPSGATAAASKAYVDAVAQGLDLHDSVVATTTGPLVLATDFENGDAIDGITLATGDRILIKNQASGIENGIYVVNASGAPTRATDWAIGYAAAGAFTFIEEGTLNADNGWVCTNNTGTDVTNTDVLTFAQFSGAGSITAGTGLTKTGNTIDVIALAAGGLVANANDIAIKPDITTASATEASAISLAANGVSIKVDNSSIEGSGAGAAGAESLRVKAGGITGAMLDPAINILTSGNIESTAGIFTGDGSGLTNISAGSSEATTLTCRKATAGTITKGQSVFIVSEDGSFHYVELADADDPTRSPAMGIAATTFSDVATGTIVTIGHLANIDTSTYTLGDTLYLGTTPGALVATRPTGATTSIQRQAVVTWVHATTGAIEVFQPHIEAIHPNMATNSAVLGNASNYPTDTPFGDGIVAVAGAEIQVDITPDIGLHFNAGKLEIELASANELSADANGLNVEGVPTLFKIGATAVGANVTAPNLDTLTGGGTTTLHSHAAAPATEVPKVEESLTTATDTVAVADPVYNNGNDTVGLARADADAKSRLRGIIRSGAGAAPQSVEVVTHGPAAGVLSGATVNTPYYLGTAGGISTSLPGASNRVILVGYAINATDLFVSIKDYGKKAA